MLRRSVSKSFLRLTPALLNGSYTAADRENELRAEAELRARVTKGMNMNFPTYDHSVYASYETSPGVFNSGGAGLNGMGGGGGSSSSSSGGHQQTPSMPQMPFPFGFMNKMTGATASGGGGTNSNSNSQQQNQQQPRNTMTDWITFFTGIILLGYSLKILFRGSGAEAGGDGIVIPMWVGTPMLKAHYIVFSAVTNPTERDALKAEFANVQRSMPHVSFFDWLNQKYPNWASGYRYSQEHVMSVVAAAVGPGSDATKIPRLMAGVMQKSSGIGLFGSSSAINNNTVDRRKLIDDMVDTVSPAVANIAGAGAVGSLFGGLIPNTAAPSGAPQHQQYGYNPYAAAPVPAGYYGGYPPPQQYQGGGVGYLPPQQQYGSPAAYPYPGQPQQQQQHYSYHQQPQHTELRGTQEVSLSDILGAEGATPVPQKDTVVVASTSPSSPTSTSSHPIATPLESSAVKEDPLKRH